ARKPIRTAKPRRPLGNRGPVVLVVSRKVHDTMRLGLVVGYSGAELALDIDLIQLAESLGFDSVWTSEAYGSDAIVPLTWIGAKTMKIRLGTAIIQMPA